MTVRWPALALAALAGAVLGLPAEADEPRARPGADQPPMLTADSPRRGWIRLRLHATPGVPVKISELLRDGTGEPIAELTPAQADTVIDRAAPWRCDRLERFFVAAVADGSSAEARLRTPSCRRRLAILAPRRVRAGRPVPYRLVDRWRIGGERARVCVEPPGGPPDCRRLRLGGRSRFAALRPGDWRITAKIPGGRTRHSVRATGRVTLLATGDSMIQIIDSFLKQRLRPRGVRVRSDARIATGISKPSLLDWQAHARRQAALKPDVVVMFLGANDGFAMGDAPCCGGAWIAEYARRTRRMMASYGRGGRTRMYWLLLPTPRGGPFRMTFRAVNAAIRRAAARARRDVRVIDLVKVFTPGGRYRDTMRVGGRVARVRQRDGVHLSTAGASLAAQIVIRTLRRERILR